MLEATSVASFECTRESVKIFSKGIFLEHKAIVNRSLMDARKSGSLCSLLPIFSCGATAPMYYAKLAKPHMQTCPVSTTSLHFNTHMQENQKSSQYLTPRKLHGRNLQLDAWNLTTSSIYQLDWQKEKLFFENFTIFRAKNKLKHFSFGFEREKYSEFVIRQHTTKIKHVQTK